MSTLSELRIQDSLTRVLQAGIPGAFDLQTAKLTESEYPTVAIDLIKNQFLYNEDFVESLDDSSLEYSVAHVAWYLMMSYTGNQQQRSSNLWNLAITIYVSLQLEKTGYTYPPEFPSIMDNSEFSQFDETWYDATADDIYQELKSMDLDSGLLGD